VTRPSERVQALGAVEIERWLQHPTVRGIADGSLPSEAFAWYLEQDLLYLHQYVRVYARLAGNAPDDEMQRLVGMAHRLATVEIDLAREQSRRYGARPERAAPTEVNLGYQQFLLDHSRDLASGLVAILPCVWGYATLVRTLPPQDPSSSHPYAEWIRTYQREYLVEETRMLFDMVDAEAPALDQVEAIAREAFAFEYRFWDTPWSMAPAV
jgi:thiaminase/transcriptional activator TenA